MVSSLMLFHEILRLFFKLSTFLWETKQAFYTKIPHVAKSIKSGELGSIGQGSE